MEVKRNRRNRRNRRQGIRQDEPTQHTKNDIYPHRAIRHSVGGGEASGTVEALFIACGCLLWCHRLVIGLCQLLQSSRSSNDTRQI